MASNELIERLKHFAKGGSGPVNDACAQAIDEIEGLRNRLISVKAALNKSDLWEDRVQNALSILTAYDSDRAALRALASEFNAAIDSTLSDHRAHRE